MAGSEEKTMSRIRIRALSVRQPFANMIASGEKTIETRDWRPNFRGELLIVSTKFPVTPGPAGCAVAICRLADCRRMRTADAEAACTPWGALLFSWILADVRRIEPFALIGRGGIWWAEVDEGQIRERANTRQRTENREQRTGQR